MSKLSKFAINMLLYVIDLILFWLMIITGIMRAMGKVSTGVPIIFLLLFVAATAGLIAYEFHYAIDEEDLLGGSNDSKYDYHKLVDDDEDSSGKEYYAKMYKEYQSEHIKKQDEQDKTK